MPPKAMKKNPLPKGKTNVMKVMKSMKAKPLPKGSKNMKGKGTGSSTDNKPLAKRGQSEKWSDWDYEEGDWAQGTNNKARPSGSGTTSWARRQRVQAAAQERDRLAAAGHADALEAQAKAAARKAASMKKQAEEAQEEAARIAEALEASRKKRKMPIPCQKEKGSKRKGGKEGLAKPCQKVSSKGSPAEPCQKVSSKGSPAEPCQKVSSKESPAEPCQKVSKTESLAEPCQKVPAKDPSAGTSQASNPCQKDSEKSLGPLRRRW